MGIKNLVPRLPERGKIKIGKLGERKKSKGDKEFQMPVKLDHFLVTTTERGSDGNFIVDEKAHAALGDSPKEIAVRLLYDDPDLNFPTRYASYNGRRLWCSGDGETAQRLQGDGSRMEVKCPCGREQPDYEGNDKCKMNGKLSVLLDGVPGHEGVGGVWSFRTTSYNSVVSIMSSLEYLRALTSGPLANIPMRLSVRAKEGTTPNGGKQTVYYVTIDYPGSEEELIRVGGKIALDRATAKVSIEHIEERARRALALAPPDVALPGDETENVIDEFYPEQAENAPPRPSRADYSGDDGAVGDATAEALDVFDLVDETGEVVLETTHPGEWVDAYCDALGRVKSAEFRETFIQNNQDTWSVIIKDGLVESARDIHQEVHPAQEDGPPIEDGDPSPDAAGFPGDDPEPGTVAWSIMAINRTTSEAALGSIVDIIKMKYWNDYSDDQKRSISAAKIEKEMVLKQ